MLLVIISMHACKEYRVDSSTLYDTEMFFYIKLKDQFVRFRGIYQPNLAEIKYNTDTTWK